MVLSLKFCVINYVSGKYVEWKESQPLLQVKWQRFICHWAFLPQDRLVHLFALNSAFFHKTYKHNCKSALTTCVYMYLTVKTVCVCALLNRDLCKQRAEIFPRCSSVLSMGTAHSQSRTPYVVPPSNTLQGLIPSSSVTQVHKNIASLTEASVLLLATRRLWSH